MTMMEPIINRIDKRILSFINKLLKPYESGHDIIVFYQILNGQRFEVGNVTFELNVGSARRLDVKKYPTQNQTPQQFEALFYNEFKVQMWLTAETFYLTIMLFHNEENITEGFHYHFNHNESEFDNETWVLPEGNLGRSPEKLFEDIYLLNKLNRELRVDSCLKPSLKAIEVNQQLDNILNSASNEQLNTFVNKMLSNERKSDLFNI